MTEYVLSIDPGVSTGITLLSFEKDSPAELVQGWQFTGGVAGLIGWLNDHWDGRSWDSYNDEPNTRGFYSWEMGTGNIDRLDVDSHTEYNYHRDNEDDWETEVPGNTVVIAEKFTARNTKGFSYTTASLEPLRGEGALIALGLMPDYTVAEKRWRDPSLQYFAGGTGKAERKKRQHAFLKANGFYRTNSDFPDSPTKDGADDFRSATAHGINYIARELKHEPTWNMITGYSEED